MSRSSLTDEQILPLLLENIHDLALFVMDDEGLVMRSNSGVKHLLGYEKDEFANQHFKVIFPPEDQFEGVPQTELQQALQTERVEEERWYVRQDGTRFWGKGQLTALRDEEGKVQGFAKLIRDETKRKSTEDALRKSEAKYRTLFDSIDEGFCIIEMVFDEGGEAVDYRFVEANRAFEQQTGLRNAVNRRASEVIPATETYWREAYSKVTQSGEPLRFENYHHATGRWYDAYASRIDGAGSSLVAVVFADVTERRQQERRQAFLLDLSDTLRLLYKSIDIHAAVTEAILDDFAVDRCYYCEVENNQAIIRRDAMRGDLPSVTGAYPLDGFPLFKTMMDKGAPLVVENSHSTDALDEELRQLCVQMQIESFINIPVIKGNRYAGNLCITQSSPRKWTDFEVQLAVEVAERTWVAIERSRTEEALRLSEEKYRTLFDSIDDGFCIIEVLFDDKGQAHDHRFLEINPAFTKQTGITDACGKTLRGIAPHHETFWYKIYGQIAATGEPTRFEHQAEALDCFYDIYAFRIGEPEQHRVAVLFHDIAKNKRAEAELKQARDELEVRVQERTQKLSQALGRVRAEVEQRRLVEAARAELVRRVVTTQEEERGRISRELHDNLGQYLTAVMLGLQSLEVEVGLLAGTSGVTAIPELANLRVLVDELMTAVHRQAWELRPAELDSMGLEAAVQQYVRDWQRRTGVSVEYQAFGWNHRRPTPEVETTLYRVVQEALTNVARHARARNVGVVLELGLDTASAIVEDNGRGFDAAQSTGRLGLIGMQERLALVGGTLDIESTPRKGTTVFARVVLQSPPRAA